MIAAGRIISTSLIWYVLSCIKFPPRPIWTVNRWKHISTLSKAKYEINFILQALRTVLNLYISDLENVCHHLKRERFLMWHGYANPSWIIWWTSVRAPARPTYQMQTCTTQSGRRYVTFATEPPSIQQSRLNSYTLRIRDLIFFLSYIKGFPSTLMWRHDLTHILMFMHDPQRTYTKMLDMTHDIKKHDSSHWTVSTYFRFRDACANSSYLIKFQAHIDTFLLGIVQTDLSFFFRSRTGNDSHSYSYLSELKK